MPTSVSLLSAKAVMKSLADLQQSFCAALRSPGPPTAELLGQIVDDGLARQRFDIYRNNFVLLNGDALGEMYPVVKRLLGEEAFRALATAYVRRFPPAERTLLLYGDGFADFLANIPELSALPYLGDVARLEYAWSAAYHAPDVQWLEPAQIATLDREELALQRLIPHPSLHCIASEYPLYRIWSANQQQGGGEISLDEGGSQVVVIRPAAEVEVREVSRGGLLFLFRLQAGDNIELAYRCAVGADETFDLAAFFARHLLDGTFSSITGSGGSNSQQTEKVTGGQA